jgi:hypothetical protein
MIRVDPRVIPAENIDRSHTVLIDTHSLSAGNRLLMRADIPAFDISSFADDAGRALANLIQALVLYETIVVDSILVGPHSDVGLALDLFPGIVRGVYIREIDRLRIGHWVQQATSGWDDLPTGLSNEDWTYLQWQTASEKPLLDEMSKSTIHNVPPGFEDDAEIRRLSNHEVHLPLCVLTSTRTLSRAHFYLELARELGVPLIVDPVRSRYFDVLFRNVGKNLRDGTPEKIIARFDSAVLQPDIEQGLISVDLSIPPVAELVLRFAKRQRCSLHEAILAVRDSKHAQAFREWCSTFAKHEENGRPGAKEQVEMLAQIEEVCNMWREDVKEGVRYKTRRLNLEHLPIIGGVLKALNMQEALTIKDPILVPKKRHSYFLFLNDLLRP